MLLKILEQGHLQLVQRLSVHTGPKQYTMENILFPCLHAQELGKLSKKCFRIQEADHSRTVCEGRDDRSALNTLHREGFKQVLEV